MNEPIEFLLDVEEYSLPKVTNARKAHVLGMAENMCMTYSCPLTMKLQERGYNLASTTESRGVYSKP
jgi:hypothetical protein